MLFFYERKNSAHFILQLTLPHKAAVLANNHAEFSYSSMTDRKV